ncbi:hypothetical protein FPOA_00412 [Fusarium poae]|uniref:Uncharacterized protein n=1 Tax=Fusarium poae TaxID=36050 RepID=A0A1B8B167_FUSPO|nr:hypothetical protein FPOA_00412 [Fusarium poae]
MEAKDPVVKRSSYVQGLMSGESKLSFYNRYEPDLADQSVKTARSVKRLVKEAVRALSQSFTMGVSGSEPGLSQGEGT